MQVLRYFAVVGLCLSATGLAIAGPKGDYLLHCGGCHLPDGSGDPPEVPTLVNELGWIVESQEGRDYLVRVPGASQAPIDDAALAAVINWILQEYNSESLGKNFKPLNAREVGRARANVLLDPLKYRKQLWQEHYGVNTGEGGSD